MEFEVKVLKEEDSIKHQLSLAQEIHIEIIKHMIMKKTQINMKVVMKTINHRGIKKLQVKIEKSQIVINTLLYKKRENKNKDSLEKE
jgi:predicted metal-dependent TIM-barrel fold hydrolase